MTSIWIDPTVSTSFFFFFTAAVLLLLFAHIQRSMRWALLFPKGYLARRFDLLLGLALGYAVNAIIPLRFGEIVRILFVSQRYNVRFSYVSATVAAEWASDLVAIGLISILLVGFGFKYSFLPILGYALLPAAFVIAVAILVRSVQAFRKSLWISASIFNDRIRLAIIDFFWSLGELIAGGAVVSLRFLSMTVVMWASYFTAYIFFGHAAGQDPTETIGAFLTAPWRSVMATAPYISGPSVGIWSFAFVTIPVLGIVAYGIAWHGSSLIRSIARWRRGTSAAAHVSRSARDRFKMQNEYEHFLGALFSGNNQVVTGFGLRAIDDGLVHRIYNGGSEAVTALVEVDDRLLIRKFAVGAAAAKLRVQANWLRAHQNAEFGLCKVVGERADVEFYRYDMPLVAPSADFYDVIHTSPIDESGRLLSDMTGRISSFHERNRGEDASPEIVSSYLTNKVIKNAAAVLDFARTIIPSNEYRINDRPYDLVSWSCLSNPGWLSAQINDRSTTTIHGDLTIENIIVSPGYETGWYFIDPNPENIFDSPLIDWAKLMQSLHLGYESLNRSQSCTLSDDVIRLALTRSHAYSELHSRLEQEIANRYGQEGLREVYFHELINYLRLTPYKIRQSSLKGLTFFACTSILLARYLERAP